jgi:cytoskeletal protein CcmA (bactofilin family)
MAQQQPRDLKINGSGNSVGGMYKKVIVRGEGDITGDVTCEVLKAMGSMNVQGSVAAKQVSVMGAVSIHGNVQSEEIKVTGELAADGDCSAENFKVRGAFRIDGLLNAGKIEIILYGPAHVREIGCDTIEVKPHFKLFSPGIKELSVDTIEGDHIRLEYTKAKVVRGNQVEIGAGCDIDLVEYKTSFRQASNAKVLHSNQV